MLGVIKELPETIKNWRENREQAYNVVASIAAALVVTAFLTGSRPSDSIGAVARGLGLSHLADWFTSAAPPFMSSSLDAVNDTFLAAALLLFAGMVIVPLLRGRHDDNQTFSYELLSLVGAPSAATVWTLLMIAAQHGDISTPLHTWADRAWAAAAWTVGALVVVGALYLVAKRFGLGNLAGVLLWPSVVLVYRLFVGISIAALAVVFSAVSLPMSVGSWFTGMESDHRRKVRAELEQNRLEREPVASGAAIPRSIQGD